ncbi:hypothetical protein SPSYN_02071 [Sporotomaculum syntrophicum]|uniref:DUF2935 domain-containing protein n=1 Tax=Sporotomaculum syntrophicum TaxID=182264 RepID=A0A9D3AVL8_9FIRM|nr:DUF2935 domain-containing protein [Sporotomaculum syntrophicum]KAF1084295.1 hypothetical protein SPSYN_02071 [Sporotomaculum syntrophicum]
MTTEIQSMMSQFRPGFCQPDCVEQDCPSFTCPPPGIIPLRRGDFIAESISNNLFWLRIMMEHALFMRLGFACVNIDLINEAQQYEQAYTRQLNQARAVASAPTEQSVRALNQESIELTQSFACFKTMVLDRILTCGPAKIGGYNFPLLIDHIRREAVAFVSRLEALQTGRVEPLALTIVRDQTFWHRIMADHAKFIVHLLDPSERGFVDQANSFSVLFDNKRFQALDLKSMLEPNFAIYPILKRFTRDSLQAAMQIRDFKAAVTELIAECELLSVIPELLADHVRREAERFVETMQQRLHELSQV